MEHRVLLVWIVMVMTVVLPVLLAQEEPVELVVAPVTVPPAAQEEQETGRAVAGQVEPEEIRVLKVLPDGMAVAARAAPEEEAQEEEI